MDFLKIYERLYNRLPVITNDILFIFTYKIYLNLYENVIYTLRKYSINCSELENPKYKNIVDSELSNDKEGLSESW